MLCRQLISPGPANRTDNIDQLGFGDRDHIVRKDANIFAGVLGFHDASNVELTDVELAGFVGRRVAERQLSRRS